MCHGATISVAGGSPRNNSAADDADAKLELSYAESSLGSLRLGQGHFAQAEEALRHSLALKEALLVRRPDDLALQGDRIDTVSWLGTLLQLTGRYGSAAEVFKRALPPIRTLREAHPADLEWLKRETSLLFNLARAQGSAGNDAVPVLTQAKAAADQLRRGDAANVSWAFLALEIDASLLAERTDLRPAARADQASALLMKLEGLRPGKPPLDSWLPRRVQLLEVMAGGPCVEPQCSALEQAMAQIEERLSALLAKRSDNAVPLETLNTAVRLQLLKAGLHAASHRAACQQAQTLLQLRGDWLQSHAELTQRWLQVQKCLDPHAIERPDSQGAQTWLQRQRSL